MLLYYIASAVKFVLGSVVLTIVYTTINVQEDPAAGIGLALLGVFITVWGLSFYIFLGIQKLFRQTKDQLRITKDSYKLSLLFGMWAMINVLLSLLGYRNKIIGLVLLLLFIALPFGIFSERADENN